MTYAENKSLLSRVSYLKKEQDLLLKQLKEQYQDAYAWLEQNGVDFNLIGDFYKKASLAVLLSYSVSTTHLIPNATNEINNNNKEVIETIAVEDIRQLNEDDQGRLIWYRYGSLIEESANKYNVDKKLIFATIMIESRGDSNAYRYEPHINDASYGLGQILYGTAMGIGYTGTAEGLYDPATNIDLIAKYHRRNMDVYGQELTAVQLTTAYNSGTPFNTPTYGHLDKFNKWYTKAGSFI